MERKKIYYVLLMALGIYFVIMMLIFGRGIFNKKTPLELTLVIGDNATWTYSNKSWSNNNSSVKIDDLNWLDYDIYVDNKNIGRYYLWNSDSHWYVFDKEKKSVPIDGNLLAIRSNKEITVKPFVAEEIKNIYHPDRILTENGLPSTKNFTVSKLIQLDIDSDGNNETLYLISNAFPSGFTTNKIFTFVFLEKNNELYTMYKNIENYDGYNGCKPYVSAILDLNNDGVYEVALSCGKFSVQKPTTILYRFTEKGFEELISN